MIRTRRNRKGFLACLLLPAMLVMGSGGTLEAQSLRGSAASLDRQNAQARAHDFNYLRTAEEVRRFVESGYLVPVRPNQDFDVHNVSFPYARPEAHLFIQRLAAQYRAACGEKLVVTSLTRPLSHQPPNASNRSVHPTGMAIDLRRSQNARCRSWLESTLLSLERAGVLEAIEERRPPHYHIALYPRPYVEYLAQRTGETRLVENVTQGDPEFELQWNTHRVAGGETLTAIARRYDTTVNRLRAENGIQGSRILVGQQLRVPVYREVQTGASQTVAVEAAPAPSAQDDAAPAPQEAEAPSPSGGDARATHTVGRGESLWTISRLYGVSEAEIRQANSLRSDRILVGQELSIPAGASFDAGPGATGQHRVARGESLWAIAQRHGVTVDELRRLNGIGTSRIYAGQVLTVPVGD
jgi:LysM repeat protein